jgi:hypothetical protein
MDLLTADFQTRYEGAFAWKTVAALLAMMPQVRAIWPSSVVDENGDVYDICGQGRMLTNTNAALFGTESYWQYVRLVAASSQYLRRISESGIAIAGDLSVGGWFRQTAISNQDLLIMSKDTTNHTSYRITSKSTRYTFAVSVDGTTIVSITSNAGDVVAGQWTYLCGVFDPQTEIRLYVNGTEYSNAVGIPAALHSYASDFRVGGNYGGNYWGGDASLMFLCAASMSSAFAQTVYHHTRPLFGM